LPNRDFKCTDSEKDLNKVIIDINEKSKAMLEEVAKTKDEIAKIIDTLESLVEEKNIQLPDSSKHLKIPEHKNRETIKLRSWEELTEEAMGKEGSSLIEIFTEDELQSNSEQVNRWRREFNDMHRLDKTDYLICGISGILAAAVDLFLIGMPRVEIAGINGGPLSNLIRELFEKAFSKTRIRNLERRFKVPYDLTNTVDIGNSIEGLSPRFHRYHTLGHDPILGFIFGVLDIMKGRLSGIDEYGKIIKLNIPNRVKNGMGFFAAIATVFGHMKSDVATPAGLPAPFMVLFNLLQFGKIGEENLTIAEVMRSMYGQGYDFIHFMSMSISPMIIEVIVRLAYFFKRKKEGHSFADSLPIDTPLRKPKLKTMLFLAHSIAAAANAGKVAFTKNPLTINWAQWIALARYSVSQLGWVLVAKPAKREKYVEKAIAGEWQEIQNLLNDSWREFTEDSPILIV